LDQEQKKSAFRKESTNSRSRLASRAAMVPILWRRELILTVDDEVSKLPTQIGGKRKVAGALFLPNAMQSAIE
jgi:hypothetical protein